MAERPSFTRCLLAGVLLVLALAPAADAQSRSQTITVRVEADAPGPSIDRNIFGQFAEHLGEGIYGGVWVGEHSDIPNVRGIRSDVVEALRELKVPNVRWPGGCFADEYHWRKGIGPIEDRPHTLNASWGGVIEPNSFGTHEFMDFLGQIGAEAFLSVNIGSGTVEEAADWLEYMTASKPTTLAKERAANGHPGPYEVRYLGLGNENWGCGGAMSTEHYVEEMKRFSRYTRNLNPAQTGDTTMLRIAVGWDSGDDDYTETVMKAWKERVWSWDIDGVSLHYYTVGAGWPPSLPSTGFDEDEYALVISKTLRMETLIREQSAIMDRHDPEKKLALAVDEWGVWLAPLPGTNPGLLQQQNSLRDAIGAALNLNIFMRHADRVRVANIAQMVNVLQAMILTDGPDMVLAPTYHVFHMYVPFQQATLIPVVFQAGSYRYGEYSMPRVDAVAARDQSGQLWLALTNIDPNEPTVIDISVTEEQVRSASGRTLTAPRVDSINTFEEEDAVSPKPVRFKAQGDKLTLTLEPKSLTVLALESSSQG